MKRMFNFTKLMAATALLAASSVTLAVCPDKMPNDTTSKLCSDHADAAGPLTKQTTDLYVKYGAGSSCTGSSLFKVNAVDVSAQRWNKSIAKKLRGTGACPLGSSLSASYDNFCVETLSTSVKNIYSNFNQALAKKCQALGGGLACLINRCSLSWYAYVRDVPPPFMWSSAADLNANMPIGIEVYRGTGDGLQAVYAKLNPAKNAGLTWNVVSYLSGGGRTPSQFANSANNTVHKAYVTINGGYFNTSSAKQSLSLIVENGSVLTVGAAQIGRHSQTYYPTRAAFGEDTTGAIMVTWPYVVDTVGTLYSYPQPSPNDASKPPQAQPDLSFPAGGEVWSPVKAIGAGPMLLKNGIKIKQEVAEMIDDASGINPYGAGPRTAVAKLADGSILFIVIDGRSTLSRGVNLEELRDILLKLGAIDALNLDGGGSSTMVVNGGVVNKPSDGTQRSLPSVLMFQSK